MFGLGKRRTKLGRFLDRNGLKQEWLVKESGINRESVSRLCDGEEKRSPQERTIIKIIGTLRRHGHDVRADDFW